MTIEEAIEQLRFDQDMIRFDGNTGEFLTLEEVKNRNELDYDTYLADEIAIKALEEQRNNGWIPITYHVVTDEERKEENIPEYITHILDCPLPDDDEEILVCHKNGWVGIDTCIVDDGYYLDGGFDWVDDITAWMPKPNLYNGE